MHLIEAHNLTKEFDVIQKKSGIKGAFKNIFCANKEKIKAVNNVSFSIERGEIVGYIGPNGAGKSTTIKMMCGILTPTSGYVTINGLSPTTERKRVVRNLGVVFGQRTQLYWDLRLGESFELLRRIYQVPKEKYNITLSNLDRILDINGIINTPVRQLSLGQRMRGELAAAMLHSPDIIFLDEPTIGLDVDVKYSIRSFIKEINKRYKTTFIITTHDLSDIQALCERVIIINRGQIVLDSPLEDIIRNTSLSRILVVDFYTNIPSINVKNAEIIKVENQRIYIKFERSKIAVAELIADISSKYAIQDLTLKEVEIDDIIRQIYNESKKKSKTAL